MSEANYTQPRSHSPIFKPEIIVAIIGLIGVLFTGLVSNWDRIFSHVVASTYTGYQPTGNFETEIRYLLDVNGTRSAYKLIADNTVKMMKENILSNENATVEDRQVADVIEEVFPKFDDNLEAWFPIYKKYYTLQQIQEMNKFYSTPIMQEMVSKLPYINNDLEQFAHNVSLETQRKIREAIDKRNAARKDLEKDSDSPK